MEVLTSVLEFLKEIPSDIRQLLPTLGLPAWIAWAPKLITGPLVIFVQHIRNGLLDGLDADDPGQPLVD